MAYTRHPGVRRMKGRCRRDPIYVSLSRFPGKFVDRCFSYEIRCPNFVLFGPNRCFWLRVISQKNRQNTPMGTQIFVKKVARCAQIPSSLRFSCGLRLRSIQCCFPYGPWGYFLDPCLSEAAAADQRGAPIYTNSQSTARAATY